MISTIWILFFAGPWSWAASVCGLHQDAIDQLSPLIQRVDNGQPTYWVLLQNQNFQISQSCNESIGKERSARLMQESMNQGLKCLKNLGGPSSDRHHSNLLKILSDRTKPAKLRCDIDEELEKKTFSHGVYAVATLTGEEEHPTVYMNPGMKRDGKFLHTDDELKFIFFHEMMHTIDDNHHHNFFNYRESEIDYTASCDVCCFGPAVTVHVYPEISQTDQQNLCKICRGDFDGDRIGYFHAFTSGLKDASAKIFVRQYVRNDMVSDLSSSSPEEVKTKLSNLSRKYEFKKELTEFLQNTNANDKDKIQNMVRAAAPNSQDQAVQWAGLQVAAGLPDAEVCSLLQRARLSTKDEDYLGLFAVLDRQERLPSCLADLMSAQRLENIVGSEYSPAYREFLRLLKSNSKATLDNEANLFRRMLNTVPTNEYVLVDRSMSIGRLLMTRPISPEERKSVLEEFVQKNNKNPDVAAAVLAGVLQERSSTNYPDHDFARIRQAAQRSVDVKKVLAILSKGIVSGTQHETALRELRNWNLKPEERKLIEEQLSQPPRVRF